MTMNYAAQTPLTFHDLPIEIKVLIMSHLTLSSILDFITAMDMDSIGIMRCLTDNTWEKAASSMIPLQYSTVSTSCIGKEFFTRVNITNPSSRWRSPLMSGSFKNNKTFVTMCGMNKDIVIGESSGERSGSVTGLSMVNEALQVASRNHAFHLRNFQPLTLKNASYVERAGSFKPENVEELELEETTLTKPWSTEIKGMDALLLRNCPQSTYDAILNSSCLEYETLIVKGHFESCENKIITAKTVDLRSSVRHIHDRKFLSRKVTVELEQCDYDSDFDLEEPSEDEIPSLVNLDMPNVLSLAIKYNHWVPTIWNISAPKLKTLVIDLTDDPREFLPRREDDSNESIDYSILDNIISLTISGFVGPLHYSTDQWPSKRT